MCSLREGGLLWALNRAKSRVFGQRFPRDQYNGLSIYRGWNNTNGLAEVANRERPDAIVVQGPLYESYETAAESLRLGYPTFFYAHDAALLMKETALPDLTGATWIANSHFTAGLLKARFGATAAVVPPLIRAEMYRSSSTRRTVTMINPRPIKGGAIAIQLATLCPDIPFLFIEAWNGSDPNVEALKAQAAGLANVTWLPVQKDMRKIYGMTRLILAPSQCHETWGRVVTEAQLMGLPTLASAIGALPDTVGPGGITVDPAAPIEHWVAALRSLWDSGETYEQYANAAADHARRGDIAADQIAATFMRTLMANSPSTAPSAH
jgi:glycosyltransferase involved in cell wall biosynthesis